MRVRKRVITLGLCLGLSVSQFMINLNNQAIANNYSYEGNNIRTKNFYLIGDVDTQKQQLQTDTIPTSDVGISSNSNNSSSINNVNTNTYCKIGLGIKYLKDNGNRKILIAEVIPNSPADLAGLQVGDEIMRVNNKKVAKLNIQVVGNLIDKAGNTPKLFIRNVFNKKKKIKITKQYVCYVEQKSDEMFDLYWQQIGPDIPVLPQSFFQHASAQLKQEFSYWGAKKYSFKRGYTQCKMTTNTPANFNYCMNNLVNRYTAEIQRDRELAHQSNMMNQYTNAINNYSHALRNQNVYHNGTVYSNIKHVIWHNW